MSQLFALGGQSIGVSASLSVLTMNIQDSLPLGLTGWISLHSKGLSRVFSNTTVQKNQFFSLSFLYSPTLTSILDYWKNDSLDFYWLSNQTTTKVFIRIHTYPICWDFKQKSDSASGLPRPKLPEKRKILEQGRLWAKK